MSKRQYWGLGCYICLTALSAVLGLSFAAHVLNIAAVIGACLALGALTLLLFSIKPGFAGVVAGCLGVICWLVLMLCIGGLTFFSGSSPVTVTLDDKLVCRETAYGFVTSDSGEELEIYKRYLLLDYRVYHQFHSDIDPDAQTPVPAKLANMVAVCQAKIIKARSTTTQ